MHYEMLQKNFNDESLQGYGRKYVCVLNRIFPDKFPLPHIRGMQPPYKLSEKNKALLYRFYEYIEGEASMSFARKSRVFGLLAALGLMIGKKTFDTLTREDIQSLLAKVRQVPTWKVTTQNYHLKALKRFLKFLNGDEDYPACIHWLKIKERRQSPIRKEDLITEEEMARILQTNTNPMHRCLLAILWEGLRVGELGTLRIRNITFEGRDVFISVTGKTGERTVMSITGAPHIRQWIDQHPKPDPNNWLFVISSNYNKGQRLGYNSIKKIISQSCTEAGITGRRIHPHLFRHSSITDRRRKGMRQREASAFYGVSGQVMTQVYDHLADTDVHNELRRVLGVKVEENIPTNNMEPKGCHFCKHLNNHYSTNCVNCGNALSIQDAIAQKGKVKELENENAFIKTELNTMREFLSQLKSDLGKIPSEKKRELIEQLEGGV